MADDEQDYEVGYGKPPKATQFKAGQSGNAKGRPRGAKNFDTVIAKELSARVEITENGKRKSITKREAIGKQVVNKAASGDPKFVPIIFSEARRIEEKQEIKAASTVLEAPEDKLVMESLLARLKVRLTQGGDE